MSRSASRSIARMQLKHKVLLTLNTMVWSLVALAWNGTVQLSATNMVPVEVSVLPARVRILVNGTPWANGKYVTTPVTVMMPINQNKITFQRTGYHSNTSTMVIQSGRDRPRVSSVLETAMDSLKEVSIESSDENSLSDVEISIDGGLEKGQIPMSVSDLVPGTHTLEIATGMWNKKTVQCQFEIPVGTSQDPIKIMVERVGKKLKFSGCKKATK